MSPEPDQSPLDPEDILWFSYDWCSLPWSPWVPFSATKEEFREIPKEPGMYRIRQAGTDFMVYIGETKRPLHQRLHDLRIELSRSDRMPWSDPHAEAPALWAWQSEWLPDPGEEQGPGEAAQEAGSPGEPAAPVPRGYECSAAPLDASVSGRRGMESFLLYRYRQEYGASPLCSLGRFHPRYRRSTTRKEGSRGGKLGEGQKDNPAGGPSVPPLCPSGTPGDRDWMGLAWSDPVPLAEENIIRVPRHQGLYLLLDSGEVIFIGGAVNGAVQLAEQATRAWEGKEIAFSYHATGGALLPHQLREMETDLIGNFFEQYRKAPEKQFRNRQ